MRNFREDRCEDQAECDDDDVAEITKDSSTQTLHYKLIQVITCRESDGM